jgi:hypothetical protein
MPGVTELLTTEAQLRGGSDPLSVSLPSSGYWADLARLLMVFHLDRAGRSEEFADVIAHLTTNVYDVHVADRLDRATGNQ